MSVCNAISLISLELESQLTNLSKNHVEMLAVMKKAPEYLSKNDLARWDADYHKAMGNDEDESHINYRVIDLVYELAGVNLYGNFSKKETKRIYDICLKELGNLGISISKNLDISKW